MGTSPDAATLERIKSIIRRDLKLGPDVAIADDMPFFGSDIDLDSLDILLLVGSIEREMGIRIPNEAVGRTVFENVKTLAVYVQEHAGSAPQIARAAPAAVDYLSRLPHGEAFRFVSKVTELSEGRSAQGVWSITGKEPFFAGHFPGNPIVPGVLIVEALAQLSGLAGPTVEGDSKNPQGKLAHVDVRFESPIVPPAEVVLRSSLTRAVGALQQFDVSAAVNGSIIARGSLTLHRSSDSPSKT